MSGILATNALHSLYYHITDVVGKCICTVMGVINSKLIVFFGCKKMKCVFYTMFKLHISINRQATQSRTFNNFFIEYVSAACLHQRKL
jgi:hypothetical protein